MFVPKAGRCEMPQSVFDRQVWMMGRCLWRASVVFGCLTGKVCLEWLLLSWLLHKWKREFSDTNFEIRNPCRCFDWMLQSSSGRKRVWLAPCEYKGLTGRAPVTLVSFPGISPPTNSLGVRPVTLVSFPGTSPPTNSLGMRPPVTLVSFPGTSLPTNSLGMRPPATLSCFVARWLKS